MTTPVVVAACGDPGGAAALAPVLVQLLRERRVGVASYAYAQGLAVLAECGLQRVAIPPGADEAWVAAELAARGAALVLVATSRNGHDHEKTFIAAAKAQRIPSVAVLDYWASYGERFQDAAGCLRYIPDRVTAMDDAARQGLVAAGIPPATIVVTGQPAFDALAEQRAAFTSAERARLRAAHTVARDGKLVLFASQPLREIYGVPQSPTHLGYDEGSVLASLVAALESCARRQGTPITLLIRPHPREDIEPYRAIRSSVLEVVVSREGNARGLAMAADVVTGMTTVLLVEAHLLGCRVASLQPQRRGPELLPKWVSDAIVVIDRSADVESAIDKLLTPEPTAAPAGGPVRLAAVPRVVSCVYSML